MSNNKTVSARLESILQKIDDIEFIISRHGGITQALNDREGQPAILMLIEAIAEQIKKIEEKNKRKDIIEKLGRTTVKGIYATRTFIAHDYDGIDLGYIESGLRELEQIKQICQTTLKEENTSL